MCMCVWSPTNEFAAKLVQMAPLRSHGWMDLKGIGLFMMPIEFYLDWKREAIVLRPSSQVEIHRMRERERESFMQTLDCGVQNRSNRSVFPLQKQHLTCELHSTKFDTNPTFKAYSSNPMNFHYYKKIELLKALKSMASPIWQIWNFLGKIYLFLWQKVM